MPPSPDMLTCPACRHQIPSDHNLGRCPACGRDFSDLFSHRDASERLDLREAARCQRGLVWCIASQTLLCITLPFIAPIPSAPAIAACFALVLGSVIATFILGLRLAWALHEKGMAVLFALSICIQPLAIFLLLMLNSRASRHLRAAGLHVGILGVRDEDVVRILSPDHCHSCGYDLFGNVSGICPECGTPVPTPQLGNSNWTNPNPAP